jgi:hypothetical protein
MNGKLYLTAEYLMQRAPWHEFDYRAGTTAVFVDRDGPPDASPTMQRPHRSFTAGPEGKLLIWAPANFMPPRGPWEPDFTLPPPHISARYQPTNDHHDLFLIGTEDKTMREVDGLFRLFMPWASADHAQGLQTSDGAIVVFDRQRLALQWLVGGERHAADPIQSLRLGNIQLAYNERHVLVSLTRPGRHSDNAWNSHTKQVAHDDRQVDADWALYDRADGTARALSAENLPDADDSWSYFLNADSSMLLMSNKALHRVTLAEPDAAAPRAPQ